MGVQIPGLSVAPSVPGVGQLPTFGITPTALPTLSVPTIPGLPTGSTTAPATNPAGTPTGAPTGTYTPPTVTVPQQVVPSGGSTGLVGSTRGNFTGALPDANSVTLLGTGNTPSLVADASSVPSAAAHSAKKQREVAFASNSAPTAALPVVLAIIAIIALALVTATYARLFLLRRDVS